MQTLTNISKTRRFYHGNLFKMRDVTRAKIPTFVAPSDEQY